MSTVTTYLDRLLDPVTDSFTPEFAQTVVDLRADAEVQKEIDELREKANKGMLTLEEDAAYKEFVEAVDVIAILQSKARRYLATRPG